MVTLWPAAVVVLPVRRPFVVSVAELTDAVLLDEEEAATCAPGGTSPPAMTVTADATVCMVVPDATRGPSWKLGAAGALMGNDPAGHKHAQLHPPLLAACSALIAADLLLPEPATTVTAALAFEVVVAPRRASLVRVAVLTALVAEDEEDAAAALTEPDAAAATTVTALPFAVTEDPAMVFIVVVVIVVVVVMVVVLLLSPEPACTVTVAVLELLPDAAWTETAVAIAPTEDEFEELLAELEVPFPPTAWTVTALPTALVVV